MSKTILVIESSTSGERSITHKLTEQLLTKLHATYGESKVLTRDLTKNPLPHLTPETVAAYYALPENQNAATALATKLSDAAIAEVEAADLLVIAAPMWNFSIPSVLKAWIDHVVRKGRTFAYGANGPEGLLKGKTVYIVLASGGIYSEGPAKPMDFQETYLRSVLGFIGLTDVRVIRAEGIAYGDEAAKNAMIAATQQVNNTVAA